MDTVAQEMCASKKTIYQWFANKDNLVEASLEQFLEQVKIEPVSEAGNSVEDLVKMLQVLNQKVATVNVTFFLDIKKYHSVANQKLQTYLNQELRPYLINNLITGIAAGFYRQDLDPEIAARLCIAKFTLIVDQEVYPVGPFNQQEVRWQVFKLFLLGIVTAKGRRYLLPPPGTE